MAEVNPARVLLPKPDQGNPFPGCNPLKFSGTCNEGNRPAFTFAAKVQKCTLPTHPKNRGSHKKTPRQPEHPSEAFLLVFLLVFFQTQKINHYATKRYKLVRRRPQPPSFNSSSPQHPLWAFCCARFMRRRTAPSFHLQRLNQRPQRRGNLPSAGIVEVKAGKRRAPIRQYPL